MNLIKGDCLEKMKDISENSIDIVIADLPYGRFSHLEWDTPIDLAKMWTELNRICKKTTPIFLFGDMKFGVDLIQSNPKHFKYEIVWNKRKSTTPLLSRKRMGKATEYIFIFYRKQCCYNYAKYHKILKREKVYKNGSFVGAKKIKKQTNYYEPSLPINVINQEQTQWGTNGKINRHLDVYEPRLPINVIEGYKRISLAKKVIKNITEKPQFILEFLLKYFSNEGDTCLDLTMGSGSCGVACKKLNRNFIGIEKNNVHFDKAKARLQ